MSDNRLIVGPAPFLHCGNSVRKIYLDFIIGLVPLMAVAVWHYGPRVLAVAAVSMAVAVAAEIACQLATKRPLTPGNLHAVYLGLLLGLLMPPTVPFWVPAIGMVLTIVVAKHFYGGIGCTPFNPMLIGWIMIDLSWHDDISSWVAPGANLAAAAVNTMQAPVEILQRFGPAFIKDLNMASLFYGQVPGPLAACAAAALLGGISLVARRRVCPIIPISFLAGVFAFAAWRFGIDPVKCAPPMFHVLSGTVIFGAFFLSTDYSSSPVTTAGKIIYGLGCGIMVMIIRIYGIFPDGVPYAILFMSLWTPILDRIRPRIIGAVREVRANG
jgi:electron transport complex protein RnfD